MKVNNLAKNQTWGGNRKLPRLLPVGSARNACGRFPGDREAGSETESAANGARKGFERNLMMSRHHFRTIGDEI